MKRLIIIGASGHGRVLADAARQTGQYEVLGFLDPMRDKGESVGGLVVLGDDSLLPRLLRETIDACCILAIGDNGHRAKLASTLTAAVGAIPFASVVHPAAVVASDVQIADGAFVAAAATVNCGSRVGEHAVVNTGAIIDHDCDIGAFAFVGPGAALAGGVRLDRGSFVGVGASVLPLITVGSDAVVGGGAAVVDSVAPGTTVAGNPARTLGR